MKKLRKFEGMDYCSFQGVENFPDGNKPMIAEGKMQILIAGGFVDTNDFGICLISAENKGNDYIEAFKLYDNVERAISDAEIFSNLLDCKLTVEFIDSFGFEVIS